MKKKIFILFVLLSAFYFLICNGNNNNSNNLINVKEVEAAGTMRIYLNPGVWNTDGAVYGAHFWNGSSSKDVMFTKDSTTDFYYVDVDNSMTNVIFVRLKKGTTSFNWSNEWNRTTDLAVSISNYGNYAKITGWENGGTNSEGKKCSGMTWSTVHTTTFNLNYNNSTSQVFVKEKDTSISPTDPTRSGYKFYGWYTDQWGKGEKVTSFKSNGATYYAIWVKYHTVYFANNQGWTGNVYANACLSQTSDRWENIKMTKTTNTYKGNYIYSASIPVIYGSDGTCWSLNYLEFLKDTNKSTTKAVAIGSANGDDKTYVDNFKLDGFNDKLYYFDGTQGPKNWKSKVSTPFYQFSDSTTASKILDPMWEGENITTNLDITNGDKDFNSWVSNSSGKKTNTLVADKDGYYATWSKNHTFYFATNDAAWSGDVYANACLSQSEDIWENLKMTNTNQKYNGYTIYSVSMPVLYNSANKCEGLEYMEIHAGQEDYDEKAVVLGSEKSGVKTFGEFDLSVFENKLYYDNHSGDGVASNWKSYVTTVFKYEGSTQEIEAWEDEKINPTDFSSNANLVGWHKESDLSGKCENYKSVLAYDGEYHARTAETYTVYFAYNYSGWNSTTPSINVNLGNINGSAVWKHIDMAQFGDRTYLGNVVYSVELPFVADTIPAIQFYNGHDTSNATLSKKLSNQSFDEVSGSLYYYEANNSGWKQNVTTNFYANDGSDDFTSVADLFEGEIISSLPTASYDGHVFAGWFDNEDAAGSLYSSVTVSASKTDYYVLWANYYTIYFITDDTTWESKGNIGKATIQTSLFGYVNSPEIVDAGFKYRGKTVYSVSLPVVDNENHLLETYTVYFNTSDSSSLITSEGISSEVLLNEYLYFLDTTSSISGWKTKVDTSFYANNASDPEEVEVINAYEGDIINPTTPSYENREFVAWGTARDTSGTEYLEIIVSREVTEFYAIWASRYEFYFATNKQVNGNAYVPYHTTIEITGISLSLNYGGILTTSEEYRNLNVYKICLPLIDGDGDITYKVAINIENNPTEDDRTKNRITIENILKSDLVNDEILYFHDAGESLTGWKDRIEQVTLHYNNENNQTYIYENIFVDEIISLPSLNTEVWELHTFISWYDSQYISGNKITTSEVLAKKDITDYYAVWAYKYSFSMVTNRNDSAGNAYVPAHIAIQHNDSFGEYTNGSVIKSNETYLGFVVYTVETYIVMEQFIDPDDVPLINLRFNTNPSSDANRISINITPYEMYAGELLFYEIDKYGTPHILWKRRVSGAFYIDSEETILYHSYTNMWADDIINLTAPSADQYESIPDTYKFLGWYDNAQFDGSSYGREQIKAIDGIFYACWGVPFVPGETLYLFPNTDWLTSGQVGIFLWGTNAGDGANSVIDDMKKCTNDDGSIYYTYVIPNDGRTFYNAIFIWSNKSIKDLVFANLWSSGAVNAQTLDLTRLGNAYQITTLEEAQQGQVDKYLGSWVDFGTITIQKRNNTSESYTVTQVVDYEINQLPLSAPNNKTFDAWLDKDSNRVELQFPLSITKGDLTYTENWVDAANYSKADFVVYYKECSTKENTYGVQPFYAGLNFYTPASVDDITLYGSGDYTYYLTLKEKGNVKRTQSYTSYELLLADLVNFKNEFSCLLSNGGIDDTYFNYNYELIFEVVDNSTGDKLLNSTLDHVDVGGVVELVTFTNLINQYIVEQQNEGKFDLSDDCEDKAIFQLHIHTYSNSTDVNIKYIHDAYYIYDLCYVCGHREKIEGVTLTYSHPNSTTYKYTTTVGNQTYSKTYEYPIEYIFESKLEHHSDDERALVYAALNKDGNLINEFKSLYAAMEACFDYDDKVRVYDASGFGSYVVKIKDNGEYDDRILFRNKKSYMYTDESTEESEPNIDMYWYYNNGASLQRYEGYANDYWTSLLNGNRYTSIQRLADDKATKDVNESAINIHASSYEIYAQNPNAQKYDITPAYNYNYELDSSANIFLVPGSTNVRFWLNLKNSEIYPSYHESDNAWAYVGYACNTVDYVLHQGLRCDTSTGNWYYYVGRATNTENGIVIEPMDIPGVTDICYMTSTFDATKGCYRPNENINLAMGLTVVETSTGSGIYNITHNLQMVFEDGRAINKSITLQSIEKIASIRFTMGLDIETNNDLADYMCGAEFKNIVITYAQANTTGVGTTRNIHNPYTVSGNNSIYKLTSVNRNSTLYNNIVSSKLDGNSGLKCTSSKSTPNIIPDPIYYEESSSDTYRVPIYNFSYRSIDSSANPFASKVQNVMDEIQGLNNIETIVQNDLIDAENKEMSYTEFYLKYYEVVNTYATLEDEEKTILQMSYFDSNHGNKYGRFIYDAKIDIDKIREFDYKASGHYYHADTGKNVLEELGGQLSYNTKTDTHTLLLSLPLYGRVELIDDGRTLTTANATNNQILVNVSGLYTSRKKADWTQRLYTDGNDYTFYCSKAAGSSYQIEYNWLNKEVVVKQSPSQTMNYVGPYQYDSTIDGLTYTAANRLQYTVEVDNKISAKQNATFDKFTNLYYFTASLDDWDGVAVYYDGNVITPTNTKVLSLFGNANIASTTNKLYWAVDGEKQRYMRSDRDGSFTYTFIYDPVNGKLYIEEITSHTLSGFENEVYSKPLSYWAPGAVLHSPNANQQEGWKTIVKSDGKTKVTANGYRLYLVADAQGRICYMVVYPTNGFGGIKSDGYYAHPMYRDYKNNPAIVTTDNYATWSLKVPTGGFGITLHQDGTNVEYINQLLSWLTHGTITAHGGEQNQLAINNRFVVDHGMRLSMSSDHKTLTVSYTFS